MSCMQSLTLPSPPLHPTPVTKSTSLKHTDTQEKLKCTHTFLRIPFLFLNNQDYNLPIINKQNSKIFILEGTRYKKTHIQVVSHSWLALSGKPWQPKESRMRDGEETDKTQQQRQIYTTS